MNKNKAAVFILLGQSNAVGHGIPMEEKDKIKIPLKNVFGLSRRLNQSFDNKEVLWEGYTSSGMNLAEEQDDTYSVANCLARYWQDEIDSGNPAGLSDLYIVHIAIGAQGVSEKYMWNPKYEKKLVPGKLGTVDISLFPFTCNILSMVKESLRKLGKETEYIGIHWRGGEEDTTIKKEILEGYLKKTYKELFDGFSAAAGCSIPIVLHRISCRERCLNLSGEKGVISMEYINSIFDELENENKNISIFDVKKAPHYIADTDTHGIYIEDLAHFTPEANKWVAATILEEYKNRV